MNHGSKTEWCEAMHFDYHFGKPRQPKSTFGRDQKDGPLGGLHVDAGHENESASLSASREVVHRSAKAL
jgi:hypothetical protein